MYVSMYTFGLLLTACVVLVVFHSHRLNELNMLSIMTPYFCQVS